MHYNQPSVFFLFFVYTYNLKTIMRVFSLLSFYLLISASFLYAQTPKIPTEDGIELQFRSEKVGKTAVRTYYVQLKVSNASDAPVWYIFPNFGDNTLPENGIIDAESPWKRNYISGISYFDSLNRREDGKPKHFVKVHFIGKKNGFYAFRLPAHATASFKDYPVDAWKSIEDVEIWEASDVLINGDVKLEDFLMYETMASEGVEIFSNAHGFYNIDWKEGDLVSPISKTEVEFIKIVPISRKRYEISH